MFPRYHVSSFAARGPNHRNSWLRPDAAEPRLASAVEVGVAVAATLAVPVVVNGAQSPLGSLLEGRVELLTWDDRMEDLPDGDDGEE